MATAAGVLNFMRSKSALWEEKIKVARYVVEKETVHIPNKLQTVIDWTCASLGNKIKSSASGEDAALLWLFLLEVLRSKKLHHAEKKGRPIFLKSGFALVILDALELSQEKVRRYALAVTCNIFSSPTLYQLFTARFEIFVKLVSSILKVCATSEGVNPESIAAILRRYLSVQKQHSNQKQVTTLVSEKLLTQAVEFWALKKHDSRWETVVKVLKQILSKAIFQSEHGPSYEAYLHLKATEHKANADVPKVPELVFNTLKKGLKAEGEESLPEDERSYAVIRYLPELFVTFQRSYHQKSDEDTTDFKLLLHLFSIVGITDTSLNLVLPAPVTLEVVDQLLKRSEEGVYSEALDNAGGGAQLKWFRQILGHLLSLDESTCPSWYHCITSLLAFNHQILAPNMSDIWSKAWLQLDEQSVDVTDAQNQLFSSWLEVYASLRQVPKLIGKIVQIVKETNVKRALWPDEFLHKLGEVVTTLPPGQALNLWSDFLETYDEAFLTSKSGDKVYLVTILFHVFLTSVKVADYNLSGMMASKVEELMKRTADEVVAKVEHSHSYLLLASSYENLHLLLRMYAKYQPGAQESDDAAGDNRATIGDFDLAVKKTGQVGQFFKVLHLMCSIRRLYMEQADEHVMRDVIEDFIDTVMMFDVADKRFDATWDRQVYTVSNENANIAVWTVVCDNLSIIARTASEHERHKLLDRIIGPTWQCTRNQKFPYQDKVFTALLQSTSFHECHELQGDLVHQLLLSIKLVIGLAPCGKKRRKSEASSVDLFLCRLIDIELSGKLEQEEIRLLVNGCLATAGCVTMKDTDMELVYKYVEVLSWQPLDYYSRDSRLRIVLALLALLLNLRPTAGAVSLATLCMRLLHTALGVGAKSVVSLMDVGNFLTFLCNFGVGVIPLIKEEKKARGLSSEGEEFLAAYRALLQVIVSYALQKEASTKSLEGFVEKLVSKVEALKVMEPTSNDEVSTLFLESLHVCLDCLQKRVLQEREKGEKDTIAASYFCWLESAYNSLLVATIESDEDAPTMDKLLGIQSMLFSYYKVLTENEALRMTQFSSACRVALDHLDMKYSPDHIKACIQLTKVISEAHRSPTQHPLFVHLPLNYLESSVNRLIGLLKQVHASKPSEDDTRTSNRAKELRTLLFKGKEEDSAKTGVRGEAMEVSNSEGVELMDTSEDETEGASDAVSLPDPEASNEGRSVSVDTADYKSLEELAHDTLVVLFASSDLELFRDLLHRITINLTPSHLWTNISEVVTPLLIWKKLLSCPIQDEKREDLRYAAHNVIVCLQSVMLELRNGKKTDDESIQTIVKPVLVVLTSMLSHPQLRLQSNMVPIVLNSCELAPLSAGLSHRSFIAVFHSVYDVLNALLLKHTAVMLNTIPAFSSSSKRLLQSLVLRSNQEKCNADVTGDLVTCAGLLEKLFALIASHKEDFAKASTYLIAEYVTSLQKVTLAPAVKKALLPGIHLLLDLCDQYSIALLHTVLNPGVKDIFRNMYQDYTKHYKYTGRI